MEWVTNNFASLLIVIGLALLAIEMLVLGFSVFILFFVGLASLVSGFLMMIGLLPETMIAAFGSVAVMSLAFAVGLWKPLKKLQESGDSHMVRGDFIGHSFVLEQPVASTQYGKHRHSGIEWKIRSDVPIPAGAEVEVTKAEVGMFTVKLKELA